MGRSHHLRRTREIRKFRTRSSRKAVPIALVTRLTAVEEAEEAVIVGRIQKFLTDNSLASKVEDVFCFADPNTPASALPPGVLHPRRVMKGVVSGVRDYGNRMGIPTVNGAIYFDQRYLGNPLVYCGNVGLIPREKSARRSKFEPNRSYLDPYCDSFW